MLVFLIPYSYKYESSRQNYASVFVLHHIMYAIAMVLTVVRVADIVFCLHIRGVRLYPVYIRFSVCTSVLESLLLLGS